MQRCVPRADALVSTCVASQHGHTLVAACIKQLTHMNICTQIFTRFPSEAVTLTYTHTISFEYQGIVVDILEEEDALKLKMLEAYISSVAIASVTQQKADEQQVFPCLVLILSCIS
jgi:hypothetical protein